MRCWSAAEARWWVLRSWLRHPVDRCLWSWKAHHVPWAGDLVTDCRGKTLAVTAVSGDDLILADGTRASWMHCCGRPKKNRGGTPGRRETALGRGN